MDDEYTIKIIAPPVKKGEEPEWARTAFVGCVFEARMSQVAGVFEVDAKHAIGVLAFRSSEAVKYWQRTGIVECGGIFAFLHSCCEVMGERGTSATVNQKEKEQCQICGGWGAHKKWCPAVSEYFVLV